MPKYTQQELTDRYNQLPSSLRQALFSVDTAEKMFEIGKKFGLTIEKTGIMAEETGYVILGLTHPKDFSKTLTNQLRIDADKVSLMVSDINHQIFFPLRETLKTAHEFEINAEALQHYDLATMPVGLKIPSAADAQPVSKPIPPATVSAAGPALAEARAKESGARQTTPQQPRLSQPVTRASLPNKEPGRPAPAPGALTPPAPTVPDQNTIDLRLPAGQKPSTPQTALSSPSAPTREQTRVTPRPPQLQPQTHQETPVLATPPPEKKSNITTLPPIPGIISRAEAEKVVVAEKEKRGASLSLLSQSFVLPHTPVNTAMPPEPAAFVTNRVTSLPPEPPRQQPAILPNAPGRQTMSPPTSVRQTPSETPAPTPGTPSTQPKPAPQARPTTTPLRPSAMSVPQQPTPSIPVSSTSTVDLRNAVRPGPVPIDLSVETPPLDLREEPRNTAPAPPPQAPPLTQRAAQNLVPQTIQGEIRRDWAGVLSKDKTALQTELARAESGLENSSPDAAEPQSKQTQSGAVPNPIPAAPQLQAKPVVRGNTDPYREPVD